VGARIRERRIMLGLTQQQLADLMPALRSQRLAAKREAS
jgi:transcriptional regulator with XRE-family HTH domain